MSNSKITKRPLREWFGIEISLMTPSWKADYEQTFFQYQGLLVEIIRDSQKHSDHHPEALLTAMAGLVAEAIALGSTPLLTEKSFNQILADLKTSCQRREVN